MEDTTPAPAETLQQSLSQFDTPDNSQALEPQTDDFLSQFDAALGVEKPTDTTPVEPETTQTTETTTETTPEEDLDSKYKLPENASPKAGEAFNLLKSDLKKTRAELREERDRYVSDLKAKEEALAERERKLEELNQQVSQLPELSEKAKMVEEAERELAISRVEATREYKDTIMAPLDAIGVAVESIASSNQIDADKIFDALTERDPAKRRELMRDVVAAMDEMDRLEMSQMSKDVQSILYRRDQIHANAVEAKKELESISERKATEQRHASLKQYQSDVAHAVSELQKRIPMGEDAETVFQNVQTKAAGIDLDTVSSGTKAYSVAAGVILPTITKQLVAAQKTIKELEARVKSSLSSTPSLGNENVQYQTQSDEDLTDVTARLLGLRKSHNIIQALSDANS